MLEINHILSKKVKAMSNDKEPKVIKLEDLHTIKRQLVNCNDEVAINTERLKKRLAEAFREQCVKEAQDVLIIGSPVNLPKMDAINIADLEARLVAASNLGRLNSDALGALAEAAVNFTRLEAFRVEPVIFPEIGGFSKGALKPRKSKRFKAAGAKKGSEYDFKKGYVKRSKRDVFKKGAK